MIAEIFGLIVDTMAILGMILVKWCSSVEAGASMGTEGSARMPGQQLFASLSLCLDTRHNDVDDTDSQDRQR